VSTLATPNKNRGKPKRVRNARSIILESELQTALDQGHLQPVDLDAVRRQITNLVGNRALEAVNQTVEHIKLGNFQAMKYLFEMVGLFPASTAQGDVPGDSLARNLLDYLETSEPPAPNKEFATTRGRIGNANAVK
jgi:hypothetical protein